MVRRRFHQVLLLLLLPVHGFSQALDTAAELKKIAADLKNLKSVGYDYNKSVHFPNGEQDHMKGTVFMDNSHKLLLNDCDAFTMLYTAHWFYMANHRQKTVAIVNLDKDYNKKLKKEAERDIFQNGLMETFLDSVLIKTATIKKYKLEKGILSVSLSFPASQNIKSLDVVLDKSSSMPVSYTMTVMQPWQNTPKGVQSIEAKIKCSGFRKSAENKVDESNYFSLHNGKIELKKYSDYKLSNKM